MNNLGLLLLEEENEELVAAAMDFIDSVEYAENAQSDSELQTESSDGHSSPTLDDSPTASSTKVPVTKPKRKRKVKPGYSTEQERRNKAELLALRTEVQGLEEWLKHLKYNKFAAYTATTVRRKPQAAKINQEVARNAMEEFKKLQHSESINHELKAILASQTKVGRSILEVIQQTAALAGQAFVFGSQLAETYENVGVLARLKDGARGLYMNLNATVPQLSATAYSSSMVPKVDTSRGKVFKSSTVCSVSCSMKFASDALWLEYSTPRKYANKSYPFMFPVGADAVTKSFDLLLESKRGAISINGLVFANKFEYNGRVAIVRDYAAFLPTAGLHMRCNHWTIITSGDCNNTWRIHFYVQMFTESDRGFTAAPQDIDYIQEVALEAWSAKMHLYSQLLHDRLEVNSL